METSAGMINSIGLENMGIEAFIEKVLPVLENKKINYIVNIAGATMDEYLELAKICEAKNIPAIELNLSCPNVKAGCLEFGTSEESLYSLVSKVRDLYSGVLITKLTPNVTSIEKIAVAAQRAGANLVSAINTVRATGLKMNFQNGKFTYQRVNGGLSGKAIKPIALRAISAIRANIDIPIIGMGGIYCLDDLFEFMAVGADAFQIGTANFTHPTIAEDLAMQLAEFMECNNFRSFDELKMKIREDMKNE